MILSLHNARVLIDIHGTDQLNMKRLIMHNKPHRAYSKDYMRATKIYRFFMTMVEDEQ